MHPYQSTYELEDTLTSLWQLANSVDEALAKFNKLANKRSAHGKIACLRVSTGLNTAATEMRAGAETMLEEFKNIRKVA